MFSRITFALSGPHEQAANCYKHIRFYEQIDRTIVLSWTGALNVSLIICNFDGGINNYSAVVRYAVKDCTAFAISKTVGVNLTPFHTVCQRSPKIYGCTEAFLKQLDGFASVTRIITVALFFWISLIVTKFAGYMEHWMKAHTEKYWYSIYVFYNIQIYRRLSLPAWSIKAAAQVSVSNFPFCINSFYQYMDNVRTITGLMRMGH